MRRCFLCGRNGCADPLDKHHLFGGAYRAKSERDGLVVYLCHHDCHIFGAASAHQSGETMEMLHEYGEQLWLSRDPERTIEDFIREYGRNYLPLDYAAPVMESGEFRILDDGDMPF